MKLWRSGVAACVLWSACAGVERGEQQQSWKVEELERAIGLLRGEKEQLEQEIKLLKREDPYVIRCSFPPKIDASVLEVVPGYPLVVLEAGGADGVRDGYRFTVFLGSTFKAQVKAVLVEEHRTLAVVLGEKSPIAVGDSASTGI